MLARSVRRGAAVVVVIACAIVLALLVSASRDGITALVGPQPSGAEQTAAPPTVQPTEPAASATTGLTEARAIEIAHTVAPQTIGWEVREARSGQIVEVWEESLVQEWARGLSPDTPVWYLYFQGDNDAGSIVLLHHADGRVIKVMDLEIDTIP